MRRTQPGQNSHVLGILFLIGVNSVVPADLSQATKLSAALPATDKPALALGLRPKREVRLLTLDETFALALEHRWGSTPEQQRADFDYNVRAMLRDVEVAYWDLYGAYWTLLSREESLRLANEALQIEETELRASRVPLADATQARGQYALFRDQREYALGVLWDKERRFRQLLALLPGDGRLLVPSDLPVLPPYPLHWPRIMREVLTWVAGWLPARLEPLAQLRNWLDRQETVSPCCRLLLTYAVLGIAWDERQEADRQLELRCREFLARRGTLDFLLEVLRVWADALRDESRLVVRYNQTWADIGLLQAAKTGDGNRILAGGAFAPCAGTRVAGPQQSSRSIQFKELTWPVGYSASDGARNRLRLLELPADRAVCLPVLLGNLPPLRPHGPSGQIP
jgi:hypothetical protein